MGCVKSKKVDLEYKTANLHSVNLSLLKTGDVILFADNKSIGNKLTRFFTHSVWTHVGIVVNSPGLYKQGPMLFESNREYPDHLKDLSTSTIVPSGVRLVDLSTRINTSHSDEIAFCQLEMGENVWDNEHTEINMQKVIADMSLRPYERKHTELIFSAIDLTPLTHNKPDLSSVFCSELVAYTLQRLEVLNKTESSNEFTPADFASNKKLSRYLETGFSYAEPQPLKTTTMTKRPALN